jgi:hypothetical protein
VASWLIAARWFRINNVLFEVVAFDRYSRDEIVGEVLCPLHTTVDLSDSDRQATLSMDLVSRSSKVTSSPLPP